MQRKAGERALLHKRSARRPAQLSVCKSMPKRAAAAAAAPAAKKAAPSTGGVVPSAAKKAAPSGVLKFKGARDLRARLVLATLARKPVEISRIRADDESPGLRREEASFVRLVDKLTSGSRIEINETGTTLRYAPGFLAGGAVAHDCGASGRNVGWFLDAVLPLAPFGARALDLVLTGPTAGDAAGRSGDALKHAALPLLRAFGVEDALEITVERREAASTEPAAAAERGRVRLSCPAVRALSPATLPAAGLVKRVRGVAYCTRAAPALANRCVAAARCPLNRLLADVRVTTDAAARRDCAPAPGFGVVLSAETLDGRVLCAEVDAAWYRAPGNDEAPAPEDVGAACAAVLLDQVNKRGCCDDASQPLLFTLMALCPEEVSVAVTGPLTDRAAARLRLLKAVFGTTFKLQRADDATVRAACLGAAYANFAKPVT